MSNILKRLRGLLLHERVRGVLAIMLGTLLLLFRALMLYPLAIAIGGMLMLTGIVEIILQLSASECAPSFFAPRVLTDLFLLFSGLYMLFRPAAAIHLVAQLLGVYLLFRMGRRLFLLSLSTRTRTPRHIVRVILASLGALGGLALLFFPARMTSALTVILGITFILCGTHELVRRRIPRRIERRKKNDYIETDFVDKSDT